MKTQKTWANEFARSFKDLKSLYQFLGWELDAELLKVTQTYPLFIPYRLAEKIKNHGPQSALAKEFLPGHDELNEELNLWGMDDPIGDKRFHKAPQIIHRYNSRVLFTPTTVCPVHCRYCFRKNELNHKDELFEAEFESTLNYLAQNKNISEIIFTGGDPFTLSNEKLEKYLAAFASIPSIKDIRFHSRYPVIFPERFDAELKVVLHQYAKQFRTLSIAIHANHTDEFDQEALDCIKELQKLPIQLLSQTVLLKGINDSFYDLLKLFELFIDLKIRPYYLHHPDRVKGGMHFYLPLSQGRRIYSSLRKFLPGWAIPHYVIDLPGGDGKISAFNPESEDYSGQFLTLDGQALELQEPEISN
ncbi:MAG: KamA family radical SAM protein [Bacteriovoracaceae bacterium]